MNTQTPITIEIPGEVMSLKNSKRIVGFGRYKKIVPSKQYMKWSAAVMPFLEKEALRLKGTILNYPVKIEFFFYRRTKRVFDYINMAQGPLDLLVDVGIIPDDSVRYVIPVFTGWAVDKQNPRVVITIL